MLTVVHRLSDRDRGMYVPVTLWGDKSAEFSVPAFYHTFRMSTVFITVPSTEPDRTPVPIGTGFLLRYGLTPQDPSFLYLVTAKHVVDRYPTSTFVRVRSLGRDEEGFETKPHDIRVGPWRFHPDDEDGVDVAVAAFEWPKNEPGRVWYNTAIPTTLWNGAAGLMPAHLGEPAYFIGLLRQVESMMEQVVPMVRSGTVGAWSQIGVEVEGDNEETVRLRLAHLIDANAYRGFSGSPCIAHPTQWVGAAGQSLDYDGPALIGLVVGHFPVYDPILFEGRPKRGVDSAVNAGVVIVTPVEGIIETINREEFVMGRQERTKEHAENESEDDRNRRRYRSGVQDSVKPGPEPERVRSDETLEGLAKRVMDAGKPDEWGEEEGA